jgi:predicted RNA binding protein with dsRBD fold (UPF0201 family)
VSSELKTLLNALLNKYERSKTFQGSNKQHQSIALKPEKVFPAYTDDAQYEVFHKVNEAVKDLELQGLVIAQRLRNGVISVIKLNLDKLDDGYRICGRTAKKEVHRRLYELWEELEDKITDDHIRGVFHTYIEDQKENIRRNKQVAYFDGDLSSYQELLLAIREILNNETEQFVRDFSVRIFGLSKKLESMEDRIRSFLYEYGECAEKEDALEEYGLVRTPTNVSMKGQAVLLIGDQKLDLSRLQGDISLSTISLAQINGVDITGDRVVTVENLTSFYSFEDEGCFVIYLGGYHNRVKRNFLKQLYESNPDKTYVHFGDIDAGGFYIYEHLIKRTGIPFGLAGMDVDTLQKHKEAWRALTANDRKRIRALLNRKEKLGYQDVLKFMLEHNCKLEQEAVHLSFTS